MASVLDGLTDSNANSQATAPAASPAAAIQAAPAPNNFAATAQNADTHKPLQVLKAVASGELPGVAIPKNAPKIASPLTGQDVLSLGLGFYKPKDDDLAAVLFNPKKVPVSTLQALDKKGSLDKAFPSITSFLDGEEGKAPATKDSPINNLNLTGSPAPADAGAATVPVLPRPTFGAAAQKTLATKRTNLIAGNVAPSARPIPGGGSVLNGLLQQPV